MWIYALDTRHRETIYMHANEGALPEDVIIQIEGLSKEKKSRRPRDGHRLRGAPTVKMLSHVIANAAMPYHRLEEYQFGSYLYSRRDGFEDLRIGIDESEGPSDVQSNERRQCTARDVPAQKTGMKGGFST